jgi:hypothetical protein
MTHALISTVSPGPVIKRGNYVDLAPEKGLKWIPDNPPSFNSAKQTRTESQSIPVDATEVPYTVADIALSTLKERRKVELRAKFEARGQAIVAGYAPSERETWAEQSKAAEAYQADPNGSHPYLEAMVREGETVADLAALILTNRAALQTASAGLIKVRRQHEAAIDQASDADTLLAIDLDADWPF